ncbi:MAG TPA: PAS domain S-box protein [bacterium]|nr:PAS domain S-box protein [bacterium]
MEDLRILYLEDNIIDVELVTATLKANQLKSQMVHVTNRSDFISALESNKFDIILCDYALPGYSGKQALKFVRQRFPDLPFIFVSGTLGEESAIDTLRSGATDYVLKQGLSRLAPAIRRAIKESKERQERKQAEEIRRRYDFIVNTSRSFMVLINRDYQYEAVNQAFSAAHGLENNEVMGKSVDQIWGKDVFNRLMRPHLDSCLSGFEINYEAWLSTQNLGYRCFHISNFPYSATPKKITHVVEVSVDVTEKKQTEIALVSERDRAQKYLDVAGVIFIAVDANEKVSLVNKKGKQILGYEETEIIGKNWFDHFVPKSTRKQSSELFKTTIQGKTPLLDYVETPLITREHGEKIIAWHNTVLNDNDGAIIGILSSGEDITERKHAEHLLRASEERYRTLVEGSGQSIISITSGGKILFVNQISEKMLGIDRNKSEGQKIQHVFPASLAKKLMHHVETVISQRQSITDENEFYLNGQQRWFEWRIHPLRTDSAEIDSALVITLDVSERKQAEKKLLLSYDKLQRTLSGIVSALTSTIEIRDPYTAGHQRRVSELACKIAEEMGVSADTSEGIRIASLVHDIGKIYIPSEILSKPGILSESEFNLIKIHPRAGHDILKSIDFPWPIAVTILQHHERMDGSGYPQSISGEEIIIEARIISVADVVESMASYRPYRPAKGIKQAIEEISANQGKYYDPEIVQTCIKLYHQKKLNFLEQ